MMTTLNQLLPATTVINCNVKNASAESMGHIKDVVLDITHGRIIYAVLAFGGFLGLGEKLFAVPWEALAYDASDNTFIVNISRDRLENAEGFDPEHWPNMADPDWGRRIYAYYGMDPV
jgi:sporulation protein YlmC with PRC-barrel domain